MPDNLSLSDFFEPDAMRVALLLFVILVTGLDIGIAAVMRAGHEASRERDE